jgi:hypothetical protein
MIARLWQGRTRNADDAAACEELLRTKILPELRGMNGHEGACVLRRSVEGGGDDLVDLTLFGSMDAVGAFAGEGPDVANLSPEARELLSDFEESCALRSGSETGMIAL